MKRRTFLTRTALGLPTATTFMTTMPTTSPNRPVGTASATTFDVIVLGVGSMGSAACYYLAKRGVRVLGLEQFDIPHEQGAHAGQSRIIRKAYFEHPDYVPLLARAYENWRAIEADTASELFYETGLLYIGTPKSVILEGSRQSAQLHKIPLQDLTHAQAGQQFPQFQIPADYDVFVEPSAGFVTPERTILTLTEAAIRRGATIRSREKVLGWERDGAGVRVRTNKGDYRAGKLVITTGAWSSELLPNLKSKLRVTRQLIAWVNPQKTPDLFALGKFPCWIISDERPGVFYGFPQLAAGKFGPAIGLKLAHHYAGETVDPNQVDRRVPDREIERLRTTLERYLPNANGDWLSHKTCLYTYSPDENFIIDLHPDHGGRVVVAAGFSGHGFKFVPVVGEVLADLATQGRTAQPVGFLGMNRF